MLRLIMLLGAAGYIYSLGHNSAAASAEASPVPNVMSSVAKAGAGWIAREVHEQTAWAAATPGQAAAAPVAPPQYAASYTPVAAEFAAPAPVVVPAPVARPARRGLQVIIEPASVG
ncbi:MAG: hypothetical protein B7Y99_11405 [Caulobacterales bacterium 32-69-10]|nr:MAG: hypothetical protein B7Y99_11405 [Caulobacterales bacterium 32-69-10]